MELTILMPCLNEAETLQACIRKAQTYLLRSGTDGEILIADNGSTDGSQEIARSSGARILAIAERGYGAALAGGIAGAKGRFVIMGDADDSYDFSALDDILAALREGNELVMGNRFRGGISKGAMPFLHHYLGNPVLSFLGKLFYRTPIGDFHCGLRGFSREAMMELGLSTSGMEFASEMVVKSSLQGLRITEVPVKLSRDGRTRPPHLRTWRDGWRHLRFLLLYSPRWLFLLPGLALLATGLVTMVVISAQSVNLGGLSLDIHTLAYSGAAIVLGVQTILFAVLTRLIGMLNGWLPPSKGVSNFMAKVTLEHGLIAAGLLFAGGIGTSLYAVHIWATHGYGVLDPRQTMRWVVPSITSMAVAGEIALTAFFLEALRVPSTRRPT